jgi:hypothetical protein
MKFWTLSIAALVLVGAASAAPATATSSKTVSSKGHQCVPEPFTMFVLAPGLAMLIKRRKKA